MIRFHARIWFVCLILALSFSFIGSADADQADAETAFNGTLDARFRQKSGIALTNGVVFLFDSSLGPYPSMTEYWRVPDRVEFLDDDGKLSIEVAAGKYYLIAVKRLPSLMLGPPIEGELFYFDPEPKGNPKAITVIAGKKTDVGVISASVPFKRSPAGRHKGMTAVEGVVTDMRGAPVEGAYVLAYIEPAMQDRPLYVSERTDKDGKFILRTGAGGAYNLRVRSFYGGGKPEEGELVNIDGPSELYPVNLKKGETISGVTLNVRKFPKRRENKL